MEHAFAKVCEVFGIESLNKHQEDAIKYVVEEKKDVFVNLPTGFGKSLIYQELPLVYSCLQSTVEKNMIVVISPLTSLMKDQVMRLISLGITAISLAEITTEKQCTCHSSEYRQYPGHASRKFAREKHELYLSCILIVQQENKSSYVTEIV